MGFITAWIIVGIITLGIYKLFELFVGRKERLLIVEKLSDKLESTLQGRLILPLNVPAQSSLGNSFGALKFGCLLLGMGLGLLMGHIICATSVPQYFSRHGHMDEMSSLIYGACTLLFGGLSLIAAFVIELKIARKERQNQNKE